MRVTWILGLAVALAGCSASAPGEPAAQAASQTSAPAESAAQRAYDALLPTDSADIIVAANIRLYPGRPPNDPGGFLKKRYDINMRCMRSLVKAMKPDAVFREYFGLAGEDAKLTDLRRELMLRFYREAGLTMESLELAPLIVNDTGDETGATFLQGVYRLADTEPGR